LELQSPKTQKLFLRPRSAAKIAGRAAKSMMDGLGNGPFREKPPPLAPPRKGEGKNRGGGLRLFFSKPLGQPPGLFLPALSRVQPDVPSPFL
jgi:hypothetical protein